VGKEEEEAVDGIPEAGIGQRHLVPDTGALQINMKNVFKYASLIFDFVHSLSLVQMKEMEESCSWRYLDTHRFLGNIRSIVSEIKSALADMLDPL
jgi:hypothetical protein